MLSVELLAAERGDAILIEYGDGNKAEHRVLIDGGPVDSGNYDGVRARLLEVPVGRDGRRHFDLLVVTHVDSDHIEGVICLLQDSELRCVFDDVWFNGWKHIEPLNPGATVSVLGPTQGEFLGALLNSQGRPWNQLFGGGPIFVPDEEDGQLPICTLRGGMELTLVSPDIDCLKRLAEKWDVAVRKAGFEPGDAGAALTQLEGKWWAQAPPVLGDDDDIKASNDRSAANGSSIAFLAEFGGRRALLSGDAFDDVMTAALRRWNQERDSHEPVPIDAFKLSHHGSENNTTPQLLKEMACNHYLLSSNGNRFDHPDAQAIKHVLDTHQGSGDPVLCFNYESGQTRIWQEGEHHESRYGKNAVLRFSTD